MRRSRWLRRDTWLPVINLVLIVAALYWLYRQLARIPAAVASPVIAWIIRIAVLLIIFLTYVTFRNLLTSYDIERFDPGDPRSLKRLLQRWRYRLYSGPLPLGQTLRRFERQLIAVGYELESDSHTLGRIYARDRRALNPFRWRTDRVILIQHEPLSVFLVDQILQQTIRAVLAKYDRPSLRNLLVLATHAQSDEDAASCAAGVVNFLGKYEDGSLGALFLAGRQGRLFYPSDRTLVPRRHRWFQIRIAWLLRLAAWRAARSADREEEVPAAVENTGIVRSVRLEQRDSDMPTNGGPTSG